MLNSMKNMWKVKPLRKKILLTLGMIAVLRLAAQIPIPGISLEYFKLWYEQNIDVFNILSSFTGGSFERFSLLCLGITPYITASIIIQLLTIVIPKLEEIQKDGEYGRRKMEWVNRWTALGLAVVESAAMVIGFTKSGIFQEMNWIKGILAIVCMISGSVLCIVIGELIKKKGVGNGISIVLMVNILAGLPGDLGTLFENFVFNRKPAKAILASAVIVAVLIATVMIVIVFNESQRRIPVRYSRKAQTSRNSTAQNSFIPLKVNPAGVVPVIFASSIFAVPQIIASVAGKGYGDGISAWILNATNQNNWFNPLEPSYTVGVLFYIAIVVFFGYFYTSITFNPMEVADNIRKQGGMIPGIRPGKTTELYLVSVTNNLVIIGSVGLLIVVLIPIVFSGIFHAQISLGGTSIVIIVGVILETIQQIDSQMLVRNYEGFLLGGK